MDDQPKVIVRDVTAEELCDEIDREARRRLGMSAEEFERRYHAGELEDTVATNELTSLLLSVIASRVPA